MSDCAKCGGDVGLLPWCVPVAETITEEPLYGLVRALEVNGNVQFDGTCQRVIKVIVEITLQRIIVWDNVRCVRQRATAPCLTTLLVVTAERTKQKDWAGWWRRHPCITGGIRRIHRADGIIAFMLEERQPILATCHQIRHITYIRQMGAVHSPRLVGYLCRRPTVRRLSLVVVRTILHPDRVVDTIYRLPGGFVSVMPRNDAGYVAIKQHHGPRCRILALQP